MKQRAVLAAQISLRLDEVWLLEDEQRTVANFIASTHIALKQANFTKQLYPQHAQVWRRIQLYEEEMQSWLNLKSQMDWMEQRITKVLDDD